MLLVIFGAGASHEYGPTATQFAWQPPLANRLFDAAEFGAALKLYPQIAGVVAQLRELRSGISLEQRLDEIQKEAESDYPRAAIDLMAVRYYLRHVLWVCGQEAITNSSHVTNYATLFRLIDRWRARRREQVCVVTFNYDTILEDAAQSVLGCQFSGSSHTSREMTGSSTRFMGPATGAKRSRTRICRARSIRPPSSTELENCNWVITSCGRRVQVRSRRASRFKGASFRSLLQ